MFRSPLCKVSGDWNYLRAINQSIFIDIVINFFFQPFHGLLKRIVFDIFYCVQTLWGIRNINSLVIYSSRIKEIWKYELVLWGHWLFLFFYGLLREGVEEGRY